MPSERLRIGRISFTNVLPLYAAFDAGAVEAPGELVTGSPAQLNALMDAGSLDISPVSSAHYFRRMRSDFRRGVPYTNFPELCIASRGPVRSVLLVSELPPSLLETRTIAATPDSASGRALLEVILHGRYGIRPRFEVVSDPLRAAREGRPTLLIGDRALDARALIRPEHVYDLGAMWEDWVAKPMVYAVWVVRLRYDATSALTRRAIPSTARAAVLDAFVAAKAWAREHPEEIVERAVAAVPRPRQEYREYFEGLEYDFGSEGVLSGLKTFGAKLAQLDAESEAGNVAR